MQTYVVLGDVMFETDPAIEYLNSEPFAYMLLTTWFRGDQYVNFSAGVHFSSAAFEKPITVAVQLAPTYFSPPQIDSQRVQFKIYLIFRV